MCLVDDETMPPAGGMRCSGDHGYIDSDGHLIYHGRSDHQVKRWGHRINLDIIQQVKQLLLFFSKLLYCRVFRV